MAKLRFFHGAMGSGKSLELIRAAYNYRERGRNAFVFSSAIDTRSGLSKITSRTGASIDAVFIHQNEDPLIIVLETHKNTPIDVILVDEAQFFTPAQIDSFATLAAIHNIPVLAYGLKVDFMGHLFPGSKRLIELAGHIEEMPTVCHCGKQASMNARVVNGVVIREGETIQIGGNESYISLCLKHYLLGEIQ